MLSRRQICCKFMKEELKCFARQEILRVDFQNIKKNFLNAVVYYDQEMQKFILMTYNKKNHYCGVPIDYCPFCGQKIPKKKKPTSIS